MSEEDPFDDLEVNDDADDEAEDLFAEMESADIDADAVWEELSEGETADAEPTTGETPVELDDVDVRPDANEAIVSKHRYCHRCEHFSEPPDVACRNPDTTIVEMVDIDHFLVRNCPVVERRRGPSGAARNDEG
ncbi:MAG: hypothetical protein ACI8UR_000820 [Natronomonas sp.]|jgi:hypothetical protein|uniref:hypothetical protein n=1 Tax=Natronomonas sp. TaxID=2184060 RepID=UPI0039897C3A